MTDAAGPLATAPARSPDDRLAALRARMQARGLDAVIVRATDAYLNEYVPLAESLRAYITGFTGSMGDALITRDRALLFIDGRYTLQAEQECPGFERHEVPLGQAIETGFLAALASLADEGVQRVGVETDRLPASWMEPLRAQAEALGMELVPTLPSLVAEVRAEELAASARAPGQIRGVPASISGRSVAQRLAEAAPALAAARVDGIVVVPLDEIAYLANLRGDHFPYQATFRAQALVTATEVWLAADEAGLAADATPEAPLRFVGEGGLLAAAQALLQARGSLTLGYAPAATPASLCDQLSAGGVRLVPMESPFARMRVYKTPEELAHMAASFARADEVVRDVQSWLSGAVSSGARVSEAQVAAEVKARFFASGATGLSFQVIAAAGAHGAIIHYSKPDATAPIREGEVFLLDTGAYYEGGYATDLTRTFLVGEGEVAVSDEHKKIFTIVLKGAIAGMSARIPKGSTGEQLDAIVRDPIWRAGYTYAHGTGHGVGVNVHEFPPRVAPGIRWTLEAGHVFSIEPGIYLPGFGGVRIENLVTLVEDPDDARFLRVRPLTFSPLDARLIDASLLAPHEERFLAWFAEQMGAPERLTLPLPPLT